MNEAPWIENLQINWLSRGREPFQQQAFTLSGWRADFDLNYVSNILATIGITHLCKFKLLNAHPRKIVGDRKLVY